MVVKSRSKFVAGRSGGTSDWIFHVLDLSRLSLSNRYLLAISGGRDSVCLLHQLIDHGFQKIHLVHLNHQLRGEASEADARFVQQLAQENNLPLITQSVAIATRAKQEGESIETAARHARHQLFAEAANSTGCHHVLLAHHAEDQAETCLFNLLRGSSGIKGMEPKSEFQVGQTQLTLLRPLLKARREDIDQYLAKREIPFREDSSNQELTPARNRLRHEVLPLLAEVLKRDIVPSLVKAEEMSRENDQIIATLLDTLHLKDPQGRLFLPKLRELPHSLQKACLKQYLQEHQIPQISKTLVENALKVISPTGPPALNLPGDRFLRRKEGRIVVI